MTIHLRGKNINFSLGGEGGGYYICTKYTALLFHIFDRRDVKSKICRSSAPPEKQCIELLNPSWCEESVCKKLYKNKFLELCCQCSVGVGVTRQNQAPPSPFPIFLLLPPSGFPPFSYPLKNSFPSPLFFFSFFPLSYFSIVKLHKSFWD